MHDMHDDPRCNDHDRALADRLDATPPGTTPAGLVDRVIAASLPALVQGRARGPHRLAWPIVVGRLAVAAMLGIAIVLGFWSTPTTPSSNTLLLPLAAASGERPSNAVLASGPFKWRDGPMLTLLAVKDLRYEDALGDLETVVYTVGSGGINMLGLIEDEGPYDRVESELLTVTSVAGGAS